MAEINKLSVGKVLDKLRRNDAPQKSKMVQLDEKAEKMDEELQRLRAATRRSSLVSEVARPGAIEIAMSVNGMVRPCSCSASKRSWQGAPQTRSTPCLRHPIPRWP